METALKNQMPDLFEGPIVPVTIKIGLPIVVSSLLSFFYLIIDTYFISMIDPSSSAPIAGTGLLFPLFFIFTSLASSLGIGLTAVTGRMVGEKKFQQSESLGVSGCALALLLGVPILLVCLVFSQYFIQLLSGSELSQAAMTYGLQYFYALAPGMILMLIIHVYGGILQGQGLTHVAAVAMLLMTIINIVLSPILIFTFNMGVVGAGLATSISIFIALLYILGFIRKGKSQISVPLSLGLVNKKIINEIVRVGLPQFLITTSFSITVILFNKFIGDISENAMNAWTLAGRIDQLVLIPITAIGGATMILASQNYGRQNLERIKRIFYTNALLVIVLCLAMAVLYIALAPWIFAKFTGITEVVQLAVKQVQILSFTVACIGVGLVSASCFQATDRPMPAVVILYIKAVATVVLGLILVYERNMHMDGVFIALAAGNIIVLPMSFYWMNKHLNSIRFKSVI